MQDGEKFKNSATRERKMKQAYPQEVWESLRIPSRAEGSYFTPEVCRWRQRRWLLFQMRREQLKTSTNMKNQGNAIPSKENKNFPVTDLKDMEICSLPDKGFKIAVLGKLNELWENTEIKFNEIRKTIQNKKMNKMRNLTEVEIKRRPKQNPCWKNKINLNWYLIETYLYKDLNLFKNFVSLEWSALGTLTFIFQNSLLKIYANIVTVYKILLTPVRVASAERTFSKLKIIIIIFYVDRWFI